MTRGSAGNVVRSGRGEDLTFDHHEYANHANLFVYSRRKIPHRMSFGIVTWIRPPAELTGSS